MTISSNSTNFIISSGTSDSIITLPEGYSFNSDITIGSSTGSRLTVTTNITEKGINPALFFRFVKSKLTKTQQDKVKARMNKLKKLIPYAKEMGQQAFYEELTKELVVLMKESEIEAIGCDTFVTKDKIDRFMSVKDRVVKFDVFENFPRVVPKKVQDKFKRIKKTMVFDSYHILYMDLTKEQLKTNSQKIQEKDPILFGCTSLQPNKYYYIADWIDEHCSLTFSKFIDEMKVDDPEFSVEHIEDINEDSFEKIKQEVMERHQRLQDTNVRTWKDKVQEEERLKAQEQLSKAIKEAEDARLAAEARITKIQRFFRWLFDRRRTSL